MNGGISKTRTRRSRVTLSKALQETLLSAITNSSAELLHPSRAQPLVEGDISQSALGQSTKRSLDVTSDIDSLPAKRARLTQTETQQPETEEEISEQVEKPILQQPKPSKYPYASFLQDFADPIHPDPNSTSVHSFVSEWLESVRADRDKRCRSDSHLHSSKYDPISRQLTRSEPKMGYQKDADGFTLPPTPASTGSRSYRARSEDSASSTASVRHPSYRRNNLKSNGIYVRDADIQLPNHVSDQLESLRAERDSPDPSPEQILGYLHGLEILARGCTEADVEGLLEDAVFPKSLDPDYGRPVGLETAKSSLISSHLIPNNIESQFRVSQPKPDLLYGYSGDLEDGAFTQPQFLAQSSLHPHNARFAEATTQGLRFPFFAIEFKAAGGTRGDLWVATNQCAGASSACLNAIDRLNTLLQKSGSKHNIDNLSYSIAVDNNTAQLYISWKEADLNYYLQRVDAFLLSSPEHFKNFRKQVRNILDWGKDKHLTQIKDALDIILEENRKKVAEDAKARPPPSDSGISETKKHKSSSSRRNSSISNSIHARNEGTNESYWEVNDTTQPVFYPEVNQQDQRQALAAEPATFATSTSESTSSFGTHGPRASHGSKSGSYHSPRRQQTFVEPEGYMPQHISDKSAFPEHSYSDDDQQVQDQTFGPSDAAMGSSTGFTMASPTKEQPAAVADECWTWNDSRKTWYHLNGDGSCEWYRTP